MAKSCKKQLAQVEKETLQPIESYVNQLQEVCENQECKWYLLCLNVLFCWLVLVVVKVIEWVVVLVVRWVYRIICIALSLIVGVLALLIGRFDILFQAISDLGNYILDAFYFAIGLLIYYGIHLMGTILTLLNFQDKKRKLTEAEINILTPIFGDSLLYTRIRVTEGRIGILGPPFNFTEGGITIGYDIYYLSKTHATINSSTLVHECVHVWQFQYGGTQYIGQSVFTQGLTKDPYDWEQKIGTGPNSWYLLKNVEARAEFISDLFEAGVFIHVGGLVENSEGSFFITGVAGNNQFISNGKDYTVIANEAWKILLTG